MAELGGVRHVLALFPALACSTWVAAAEPSSSPDLDQIVISGNHLVESDIHSISPVTMIDNAAIAASSATSVEQLLARQPIFGTQGVNGNQDDGGYGAAFVDLRGLNFDRTLVLVNGRHFVKSGIQTDEAVDLNTLPLALIDHIEILRDGAQPSMGAEAIAGVVNIITKRDFEGLVLSGMAGLSGAGDGGTGTISATLGRRIELSHGGSANVTLSASQTSIEPIRQSNRAWARDPITDLTLAPDGSTQIMRGESATPAGHVILADGTSLASGTYDFSSGRTLTAGQDRKNLTVLVRAPLNQDITAFSELSYNYRRSGTLQPPATLGVNGTEKYPAGLVIPATDPFNPYGEPVTLQRVLTELGNQETETDATTARAVLGIEGTIRRGGWTLSINHGETHQRYITRNEVNLTSVMQSLTATPGANYFGMNSLSAIDVSQIRYVADARSTYRETEAQASLHRELVDLPAGPLAATVGGEFHREYGSTMPDRVTLAGDQAGPDQATTAGGYASREAFLDLRIPLISNVSAVRELVLEGAARYADTSLFGDFPVWKSALSWAFSDDVRFRATLGAGHRVPAISEAFGGSTASFLSVQDPCDSANGSLSNRVVAANCRRLGLTSHFTQVSPLIDVTNGGNSHLHPEQSENHTLGIVVTPSWVKNLSLSADYYAIRLKDAINSLSDTNPNFIPDQCFGSVNLTSPLCTLITRIPSGPLAGQINRIAAPDENIGAIHTDGIDFALSYLADFSSLGHLSWDWQNSFLIDYRVQEQPGGPMIHYAGSFPSLTGGGSYSRYKSNLTTEFEQGSVRAGWTVRYIDGAKVQGQTVALYDKAPGIFYHDAQIGWQQGPWRWTMGVDNLFDQKPPTLIDGATNTNSSTYDVIGRFFYLKATLQFP